MNEGDIANKSRDEGLELIITKRVRFDTPSEEECVDCNVEIPLVRRNLGSVKRCVDCQSIFEFKSKHKKRA